MRHRPPIRRSLLAALALLAPLGGTYAAATAPPANAVTGVVTLDGTPIAGATVTLTVLPSPGTVWPTRYRETPVAIGQTGPDGTFALPLNLSQQAIDTARAVNSGATNLKVQAYYNTYRRVQGVNLPQDPPPTDQVIQKAVNAIVLPDDPNSVVAGGKGTAYSAVDFTYTTVLDTVEPTPVSDVEAAVLSTPDPLALELMADRAVTQVQGNVDAISAMLSGTEVDPGDGGGEGQPCRSAYGPVVTVESHEIDYQPVGEGHVMYDSTGSLSYGEHANTDLTGAYAIGKGAWNVSGSASHIGNKGSTMTKDFTARQAMIVTTGFRYRRERVEYSDDYGDGHVCRTDHEIVPETWVTGEVDGADVSSHDSAGQLDAARGKQWAVPWGKGLHYSKDKMKGHKYKVGVKAFGIDLSAQSTWSAEVDMRWNFGQATDDHWLYGSNGTPDHAETVYAW